MIISTSITGKDKSGIIAGITKAIFKSKGNLEDASMTILEGEFAMIFLASFKTQKAVDQYCALVDKIKKKFQLSISVKTIKRSLKRGQKHLKNSEPWVVSALGKDRAGIVYHVSNAVASCGFNITDLNSQIIGAGSKAAYALILELDIPKKKSHNGLKRKLAQISKKLNVSLTLKPLETAYL